MIYMILQSSSLLLSRFRKNPHSFVTKIRPALEMRHSLLLPLALLANFAIAWHILGQHPSNLADGDSEPSVSWPVEASYSWEAGAYGLAASDYFKWLEECSSLWAKAPASTKTPFYHQEADSTRDAFVLVISSSKVAHTVTVIGGMATLTKTRTRSHIVTAVTRHRKLLLLSPLSKVADSS
jgi:hypothetical protein